MTLAIPLAERVIAPVVDDWFLENREDRESDGFFHPSSLSQCLRQAMYEATATEKTDLRAVRSDRIVWLGNVVHDRVQEALRDLPGWQEEIPVEIPYLMLKGAADGMWAPNYVLDEEDPYWELVEFKTEGIFKRKRREKNEGVSPAHEKQVRLYMMALNMMGWDVPSARVVYLVRDDLDIQEYVLDRDADLEARYTDELENMKMLKAAGMLPPRLGPSSPMLWVCDYCPWKTRCWDLDSDMRRYDAS
jgi:hypothetical protein